MVAASVAARAARIHVISGAPKQSGMVGQMAERQVAPIAEQSTVAPALVAMVDVKATTAIVSSAKVASDSDDDCGSLLGGQSIAPDEIGSGSLIRSAPVVPILGCTALITVPFAVFSHPSIFTFPARRLANVLRSIVKAKFTDLVNFATPATDFLFHKNSIADCVLS